MRTLILPLVLLAALPLAAVPADARAETCTSVDDSECPAVLCADRDADRTFEHGECVRPLDLIDPCMFQSDCCRGTVARPLWCPEDS